MRLLLCIATVPEIPEVVRQLFPDSDFNQYPVLKAVTYGSVNITLLLTGIGPVSTAAALTPLLIHEKFDLAVNLGIAGSFSDSLQTGDVALAGKDILADLGAQDGEEFIHYTRLDLPHFADDFIRDGWLIPEMPSLKMLENYPVVNAITVSTVHGQEQAIEKARKLFNPAMESQEGAAFFLSCMKYAQPCLQARAISNKVERRNRSAWDIPCALESLNKFTGSLLHEFATFTV